MSDNAGPPGEADRGTLRLSSDEFLDLCEEVLCRQGTVRFRAEGTSMRPAIKSGDVVLGEPFGERAPEPGEVVLLRAGKRQAVVHRVVARRRGPEGWLFITGGDATGRLDRIVPGAAILARVVAIARAGQRLPVARKSPGAVRRMRAVWRLLLHGRVRAGHPLRTAPSALLSLARVLRGVFLRVTGAPRPGPGGSGEPAVAGEALATEVRSISRWWQGQTYIVNVRSRNRVVGQARLTRAYRRELKLGTWWIINLHTRGPLRGRGVGRRAVEGCLDAAREHGIGQVFAAVDERNAASLALFISAGFERTGDADLEDAISRVHQRPLLARPRVLVLRRSTEEPPIATGESTLGSI